MLQFNVHQREMVAKATNMFVVDRGVSLRAPMLMSLPYTDIHYFVLLLHPILRYAK